MKTNIIVIALILFTAVLSAGQLRQAAIGQTQTLGKTQGSDPTVHSDAAKATGGVINNSAKLIIENGAFLVISGAGNYISEGTGSAPGAGAINLTGDFVNGNSSGAPVGTTGTVNFSGTAQQTISGSAVTFGNVSFTNPAGISIACDTQVAGGLTVDAAAGTIAMTDYDFGVTGAVVGAPAVVVNGSGAVGNVGADANVTVDSPQPTGLPALMSTLVVNPGAAQTFNLPNSTSVSALTFTSGSLALNSYTLLLRTRDLALSGANTLSALTVGLSAVPGTLGANSSINKTWNITGQSSGSLTLTLRWQDIENNGNDFSSGFANLYVHNGTIWQYTGRYPVSLNEGYNLVSFSRSLGAKAGTNDFTLTGDNQTLPVEMSAFTAIATSEMFVNLSWTTQSETGMSGYFVYRNTLPSLAEAINLNRLVTAENSSTEHTYHYIDADLLELGTYYYWLQSVDIDGSVCFYGPVSVILSNDTPDVPPVIPVETKLQSVYPNPFNPTTTISYSLKAAQSVSVSIYNTKGQRVKHFTGNHPTGGNYRLVWDGKSDTGNALSSGIYQVILKAGKDKSTCKISLLK